MHLLHCLTLLPVVLLYFSRLMRVLYSLVSILTGPGNLCAYRIPIHANEQVSVDYSQVSCLTAEGVGKGHVLKVTVGGQTSNIYPANISYSTPNVATCKFVHTRLHLNHQVLFLNLLAALPIISSLFLFFVHRLGLVGSGRSLEQRQWRFHPRGAMGGVTGKEFRQRCRVADYRGEVLGT